MQDHQRTLRSVGELAAAGLITDVQAQGLDDVAERYVVAVTPVMAGLVDRSDPADPIAAQFIPDVRELIRDPLDRDDPIGDRVHEKVRGLVHRYPDRVLMKLTHVCPVYCRFCFRREMVGPAGEGSMTSAEIDAAVAYVGASPAVREVIFTGGDPLMLSPRRIEAVSRQLSSLQHVRILRWHSRVPVVDPSAITDALIASLRSTDRTVYVGIHVNHPRELTGEARRSIARMLDGGLSLVSQTVLLKGVNDSAATLAELFNTLVELRVRPYYLHQADLAPGTAHFRTTLAEGQAIMRQLRGRISGLAQPTYVLDIPGGYGKVPVGPDYRAELEGETSGRRVR